jgi:hypothetical protein
MCASLMTRQRRICVGPKAGSERCGRAPEPVPPVSGRSAGRPKVTRQCDHAKCKMDFWPYHRQNGKDIIAFDSRYSFALLSVPCSSCVSSFAMSTHFLFLSRRHSFHRHCSLCHVMFAHYILSVFGASHVSFRRLPCPLSAHAHARSTAPPL